MKPTIFKRLKTIYKTEINALQNICTKKGISPNQLKACHEERCFAWELIEKNEELTPLPAGHCGFAKSDYSESEAIQNAIKELDTFEGNLKTEHTETHYVFAKVR